MRIVPLCAALVFLVCWHKCNAQEFAGVSATLADDVLVQPIGDPSVVDAHRGSQLQCRHARAGWPQCVAPWARTTYGPKYGGYYVGGGLSPLKLLSCGDRRCPDEGTWGVDYAPWYTRVALLWSHGRLYQGGTGQYEPEHRNWPLGLQRGPRHEPKHHDFRLKEHLHRNHH